MFCVVCLEVNWPNRMCCNSIQLLAIIWTSDKRTASSRGERASADKRGISFKNDGVPSHFGQLNAYFNKRHENR
jgi:hypothetical protein